MPLIQSKHPRIGVYVCHCGHNIAGVVDVKKVREYAESLPHVVVARDHKYTCSEYGQNAIEKDIKEFKLERVVVASCSPRMHEQVFRNVLERSGLNPYLLDMVNIRDQCSWVHPNEPEKATEKAIDLVRGAVSRAIHLKPLKEGREKVVKAAMVIGAGIAGIFSALYLANNGIKTYLIERKSSIGGHMAMLDKTFPTLDCGLCILSPKMVEVAQHPNIEIITYADVSDIEGHVGNFRVKIRKNPRYVNLDKCVACGLCAEKCPVETPDTFNCGYSPRKAIYIRYPQAVPNVYLINPDACLYLTKGKPEGKEICQLCVKACEMGAINFGDETEFVEINVGAVIIATGYGLYDPSGMSEYSELRVQSEIETQEQYGYRRYGNVLTNLDFERMINASGFTQGKITRLSDDVTPDSVAFIQCIGSRNEKINASYCPGICCMITIKQAILIKEKHPDTEVYVYYTDIRTTGRESEEFYRRAREMGVMFIRGMPGEITEDPKTQDLILIAEDMSSGKIIQNQVGMVILAAGLRPSDGTPEIARKLHVPVASDGFILEAHPKLRPAETNVDGVLVAGCAQFPKDIPATVLQAGNAAAAAMDIVSKDEIGIGVLTAFVDKDKCTGCGLCAEVCPYEAITIFEGKAKVEEVLCKGCGACSAACPSCAIQQKHFTDLQLYNQINSILGVK
ncbi:MAG: CoB--CoM heterodisulfide reductase iron-sulfur subunit A family protein [Candidatus Altiarchaeota archaeon]|nr:CoB--CoM heterodisulfide reductase iron-sulfur subunit A family protein [Candidatus Altiarchaeota archaeon]